MKPLHALAILALAAAALAAGCSSTGSAPSPAPAARPVATAPTAPKPAPAPAPAKPAPPPPSPTLTATAPSAPPIPYELSPEAAALVERFTGTLTPETLRHQLTDTTGFPQALGSLETGAHAPRADAIDLSNQPPPEGLTADGSSTHLVVRDWTGLVLVPLNASLSKAHTSYVRLLKVEAHPLNDGRVRIWTRIHNISNRTLPGQVACSFRMRGLPSPTSPYFYELQVPANGFRDVFFVSPDGELTSYTVLVRSKDHH